MRKVLSAVLIVLACVLVPLGGLSAWAKYEIGDTGRYVETMAPLAAGPDVQGAIADTVTDGIMSEVEVVGPLEGEVRAYVRRAVRSFTGTEAFRAAWNTANRAAHDAVLRALRSDSEGAVTLDLAPVTARLKAQLADDRVPLANRIPVEHTEVTVLRAQELSSLRKGFHMLEVAGFWLPLTAVALAAGGILLAVRRRRAVTATALGLALGAALLALATVAGRALTLAGLPPHVSRAAVGAVYDALTSTLRTATWFILALGLTVALATWLTDHRARRRAASAAPAPAPAPEPTRARA
ncbi:hypothetical protein O1Q96_02210 [Streptomyces sp. Qhu-G9]|uniref:hypothetical protein n=1 Tax=Streptomyces sp. Qhu-G9 TaxID=3452799 RepID=UPI0022AC5317|nr:hypothetical protein [Streptomyces aurantiacus]WAU78669.1 hypothetical protein O1Q96_02210 [Streptomyces aurantiacus]